MSKFDQELVRDLRAEGKRLAELKARLYGERPGCVCNDRVLCAWHADVANRLTEAERELALADNYLRGSDL